ncbi:MAG: hypothetical protein JJT88_09265 [Gammaproteobacteria bacterium]|jgi:hypothetical protein|nr:hypothetical protein [Gammaproteobacteria bacterium]
MVVTFFMDPSMHSLQGRVEASADAQTRLFAAGYARDLVATRRTYSLEEACAAVQPTLEGPDEAIDAVVAALHQEADDEACKQAVVEILESHLQELPVFEEHRHAMTAILLRHGTVQPADSLRELGLS